MTVLYIILAVLILLITLLLLPLKLKLSLSEEFDFKLRYIGITLIDSKKKTEKSSEAESSGNKGKKEDNFFVRLFYEKPFPEFFKTVIGLIKKVLTALRYILKHVKIRKLRANIVVASSDAATTGIYYGIVCATLYTFLEFLESNMDIAFKKVDVNADFEGDKPSIKADAVIKISPLFIIITAVVFAKYYFEITKKEGSASNERK